VPCYPLRVGEKVSRKWGGKPPVVGVTKKKKKRSLTSPTAGSQASLRKRKNGEMIGLHLQRSVRENNFFGSRGEQKTSYYRFRSLLSIAIRPTGSVEERKEKKITILMVSTKEGG